MVFYHNSRQRTKHKRFTSVSACCPLSTWLSFTELLHSSFLSASRAEVGMALFLKHLESKRWGRCIFRCSEVRIWILTKYNTNFWGFSLVILGDVSHGYAAKQNYITVTGVPVVLLITFFFPEFTELPRDIYIYVWNCSSYVSGSTAYCFCSRWRLFLVFRCLSDRFKAVAMLQPLQDLCDVPEAWLPVWQMEVLKHVRDGV